MENKKNMVYGCKCTKNVITQSHKGKYCYILLDKYLKCYIAKDTRIKI